jgi:hypothetical protein
LGASDEQQEPVSPGGHTAPSEDAVKCYRLHFATEYTQIKTAELLTQELHRDISQGQVSRWIAQVKSWIAAGNVLPPMPQPIRKVQSIDPDAIDMGSHMIGRSPNQRERRSDDE